jgi:hypothetical protein
MTCLEWIKQSPGRAVRVASSAVLVTLVLITAWESFSIYVRPEPPVLLNWKVERTSPEHTWLIMTYQSADVKWCSRIGALMLTRAAAPPERAVYIPLGGVLSGRGLGSTAGIFDVWVDVSGVPAGRWTYIYRAMHYCAPFATTEWPDPGHRVEIEIP